MNKTEARYAQHLRARFMAGELMDYRFEAVKLRLGSKCFYTPDFLVILEDGLVELHEVKGYWEDDARVKIQTAASLFPWFRFIAIEREGVSVIPARPQ